MASLLDIDLHEALVHLFNLAVAYVLALPIGWNREKQDRSAGLRTFPLVALATCGFVEAAEHSVGRSPEAMARIIEGSSRASASSAAAPS